MHSYLKQSTASQSRSIGPFLDSTDFQTAETGLTIANTDIKLMINGAASANKNSGGGTHRANGVYGITFDATDTATVGEIFVSVVVAGALPVFATFVVVEEAVYDQLFAASAPGAATPAALDAVDNFIDTEIADIQSRLPAALVGGRMDANVGAISGDATAADNLETLLDDTAGSVPWAGIIDQGTAQSATGTTLVLRAAAAFANDELIGATIVITGGSTGVGQARTITDYDNATDTATLDAWTTTPSGTITYKIFATAPSSGSGGGLDAAGVRAAIGMASANLDTQLSGLDTKLNTIDDFLDTEVAAIKAKTDNLPSDPADQSLIIAATDALATLIGDVPTNAELATALAGADDAVLAVLGTPAGVSISADIAAVKADTAAILTDTGTTLDGKIDGIKAKTDSLTFTVAGKVDSNITHVIADPVQVNGATDTNWGGAP
jgi:hypothetical protein